jgi:hypothetical protein
MHRNRWIILGCVLVAAAGMTGSGLMMPGINDQRIDAQLTYSSRLAAGSHPRYAWIQMAGSFQGLILDVLWMRIEKMKQEGKYHEAVQLSDLITTIQPHFHEVWVDRSHNLSYNISVGQKTPEERWMWVMRGANLLRDKGIPVNPRGVSLYKQLGWIFIHKIGQDTDSYHQYYKTRLAGEWTLVMGPPIETDPAKVVAAFKPIADAFDAYVNPNALFDMYPNSQVGVLPLGPGLRRAIDVAIQAQPELKRHIATKRHLSLGFAYFKVRLRRAFDDLSDRAELIEALEPLRQLVDARDLASRRDPKDRFLDANPKAHALVASLAEMGFEKLDYRLLSEIGRAQSWRASSSGNTFNEKLEAKLMKTYQIKKDLVAWLVDEDIAEEREKLIAYLRARILHDFYNMDPSWMHELMAGEWLATRSGTHETVIGRENVEIESTETGAYPIPLDWRLPASHGLYWASLGVRRGAGVLRPQDFDVMNTDRNVIHALKLLYERGNLLYDPIIGDYNASRNLYYAEAYGRAVFGAFGRIVALEIDGFAAKSTAPKTFLDGHENFFLEATVEAYFANDLKRATRYLNMLRDRYGNRPGRDHYFKTVNRFAMETFEKDDFIRSNKKVTTVLQNLVQRAIVEGLAKSDLDRFQNFVQIANYIYDRYHELVKKDQGTDDIKRRGLPPFNDLVAISFIQEFLATRRHSLVIKARAWKMAPEWLRVRVYGRLGGLRVLFVQARELGWDLPTHFQEPRTFKAYAAERARAAQKKKEEQNKSGPTPK